MKKGILCFLVMLCCCVICKAQQVVSSGGYAVKSEVSVNWILGGSLSDIQAIDQGSLNKLRMEQLEESEISLKVYPVPATDFIKIEIMPIDTGRFILELFNNSGVKILNKVFVNQPVMQVNISRIPSGIYFLKIFLPKENKLLKVEKIIKK